MISNHANDICKIYINTYLNKSRRKLNRQRIQQLKNTLDNVMNGCVEDVMFTGISEVSNIEQHVSYKFDLLLDGAE